MIDDDATPFEEYQPSLTPPWLQVGWGAAWTVSFGQLKSLAQQAATDATKCAIVSCAPPDSLPLHGDQRNIERLPGETEDQYRGRLESAWETWGLMGSDAGVVHALALLGFTARIKRNNQWDWDGHPGNVPYYWARMWPIIDQPNPATVGDVLGSTFVLGTSRLGVNGITDDQIEQLRRQSLKWSDSSVLIPVVIVRIEGDVLGDTWVLGTSILGGASAAINGG